MAVVLPPDLLYLLGDAIYSRSILAALCRVSKAFNSIFTPILYRRIRIQDCEQQPLFENVSKLPSESHLRFTKELHLGRNIPRFSYSESGDDLGTSLDKMSELVSLAITHSIAELNLCNEGKDALKTLAQRGKLRELTIFGTEWQDFPHPLPVFTNLTSLHLQCLSSTSFQRVNALADMLIASPSLKHLSLGNGSRNPEFCEDLHKLAEAFDQRRSQRGGSVLRLEGLHLGTGYRPIEVPFPAANGRDYLSQLTDLEYLTSLSLDNHPKYHGSVYTPLFHSATRMKEFAVLWLSPDSLDLLTYLCRANPTTLTSLSFKGLSHPDDERYLPNMPALIALAPHLNHSWKSLSFTHSFTKEGNHYLKDFISHCTSLEYLACPMYKYDVALFKTFIPDLKHLHTIIITKGNFPDHVPSTVNVSAQLDARDSERADLHTQWQPFSAHPEIARVSVNGQRKAKDLARERGEKIRRGIAEELFRASSDAWAARQEDRGAKLKYVGLGCRVYTWMLPGPGEKGDEWRVEQLSLDEARMFREVGNALV